MSDDSSKINPGESAVFEAKLGIALAAANIPLVTPPDVVLAALHLPNTPRNWQLVASAQAYRHMVWEAIDVKTRVVIAGGWDHGSPTDFEFYFDQTEPPSEMDDLFS
jgi:hypothetical protein